MGPNRELFINAGVSGAWGVRGAGFDPSAQLGYALDEVGDVGDAGRGFVAAKFLHKQDVDALFLAPRRKLKNSLGMAATARAATVGEAAAFSTVGRAGNGRSSTIMFIDDS